MKKTTHLRSLIESPEILVMPAAFDGLSARLVAEAGFQAVQCTGLGVAASEAMPDFSILSMREMVDRTRTIVRAVDLPVMGDGDTGYGSAVNVWYTVQEFESAGAAGVNLEDQVFPKRCGRIVGKDIVSIEEMQLKIAAACDAREDQDFVINARTDALSLIGMDEAVRRGNAYMNAGATMIFVQGVGSLAQAEELAAKIRGPVAMNLMEEKSSCGELTFAELQRVGIARVSLSVSLLLASMHGMRTALQRVKEWGGTRTDADIYVPFADLHRMAGMPQAQKLEERFVQQSPGA
jgi:2-methylisocitrate lyase-like PEP mutase family enzyme